VALEAASDGAWTNDTLHQYLEAFAAWLADSGGYYYYYYYYYYYANRRRVPPGNGWAVVNDALKAATSCEWALMPPSALTCR
jgi:hypothetical protein